VWCGSVRGRVSTLDHCGGGRKRRRRGRARGRGREDGGCCCSSALSSPCFARAAAAAAAAACDRARTFDILCLLFALVSRRRWKERGRGEVGWRRGGELREGRGVLCLSPPLFTGASRPPSSLLLFPHCFAAAAIEQVRPAIYLLLEPRRHGQTPPATRPKRRDGRGGGTGPLARRPLFPSLADPRRLSGQG